jgi:Protein of unknown function (DUF2550)
MRIFEVIGIGVLAVLIGLGLVYLRREIISRAGGTIEMNLRLSTFVPGRGWSSGLGRFAGEQLRWYRVFSFGVRPRRVLTRYGLKVEDRRIPEGPERLGMPDGWIIIRCIGRAGTSSAEVELAMAESALTGFLSWLESAPPGALRHI